MDQSTYTKLTGKTVDDSDRFKALTRASRSRLERVLGWPLCPDGWANQYIEIGKTRGDCSCSVVDTSNLDAPDEVVGTYRYFDYDPLNIYLPIDPAVKVHAVKLVRNGITYKTFDPKEYRTHWDNAKDEPIAKYIELDRNCFNLSCNCWGDRVQIAVDADWGYECLPYELQLIWADTIAYGADDKSNIKSESLGSHSYTKFSANDPVSEQSAVLADYAGPHGTAYRTVRSA